MRMAIATIVSSQAQDRFSAPRIAGRTHHPAQLAARSHGHLRCVDGPIVGSFAYRGPSHALARLHALTHPASGAPWNPVLDLATTRFSRSRRSGEGGMSEVYRKDGLTSGCPSDCGFAKDDDSMRRLSVRPF